MEQKIKELEQVSEGIEETRNKIDQTEQKTQEAQLQLAAMKIEKQRKLFDVINL